MSKGGGAVQLKSDTEHRETVEKACDEIETWAGIHFTQADPITQPLGVVINYARLFIRTNPSDALKELGELRRVHAMCPRELEAIKHSMRDMEKANKGILEAKANCLVREERTAAQLWEARNQVTHLKNELEALMAKMPECMAAGCEAKCGDPQTPFCPAHLANLPDWLVEGLATGKPQLRARMVSAAVAYLDGEDK